MGHGAYAADFAPDGDTLCHPPTGGRVIAYNGRVLYRTAGMISGMRISPSGDRIAFLEHPMRDDDAVQMRSAW